MPDALGRAGCVRGAVMGSYLAAWLLGGVSLANGSEAPVPPETTLLVAPPSIPTSDAPRTTTLSEVMRSAEKHLLPRMNQAFEVDQAEGRLLAARGAFDLKIAGSGAAALSGKYDERFGTLALKQQTSLAGLAMEAGYRHGAGYPVYAAKAMTSRYGEAFGQASLPLLQGSSIDSQRLERDTTYRGVEVARAELEKQRLALLLDAGLAYYSWVKTHRYLEVERVLVALAEGRARLVESSVAAGQLPRVELLDNERLIAERREQLLSARSDAEQSKQELAFFKRDAEGRPSLPDGVPEQEALNAELRPTPEQALQDVERRHPFIQALQAKEQQLMRRLAWADNQRLPNLDLNARVSKDFGAEQAYAPFATTPNKTEVMVGLEFAWPVQQRKARGKAAETTAKIRQLQAGRALFLERLATNLRAIDKRLELVKERLVAARAAERSAQALADAERDRFDEGQGTIFMINQREKVAASATKRVIEVEYDYATLWLKHQYLTGKL